MSFAGFSPRRLAIGSVVAVALTLSGGCDNKDKRRDRTGRASRPSSLNESSESRPASQPAPSSPPPPAPAEEKRATGDEAPKAPAGESEKPAADKAREEAKESPPAAEKAKEKEDERRPAEKHPVGDKADPDAKSTNRDAGTKSANRDGSSKADKGDKGEAAHANKATEGRTPPPTEAAKSDKSEKPTGKSTIADGGAHEKTGPAGKPAHPDGGTAASKPAPAESPAKPGSTKQPKPPVVEAEKSRHDAAAGPDYMNAPKVARGSSPEHSAEPPPPTASIPGGPLNIPGSKVNIESKLVERFLKEGGIALYGRILDADTGKPVEDAEVEAWMDTQSMHSESDAAGHFRFDGLVPGSRINLWITSTTSYVQERIELVVPKETKSGRIDATYRLLPRADATAGAGGIGVFLSRRAGRTIISGLDAFGPAESAGAAIGDAIIAIGKRSTADLGPGAIGALLHGPLGADVEITLAGPAGAPRTVTLKRAGR